MEDGVRFIFKTLLRVPITIMICYVFINIFSFTYTYFRVLSFSFVTMQTAVENGYLPQSEAKQLKEYLETITSPEWVDGGSITINGDTMYDSDSDSTITGVGSRVQYGSTLVVTVEVDMRIIWPLMTTEQMVDYDNGGVAGYDNSSGYNSTYASESTLEARRNDSSHRVLIPIKFTYTVPSLKYYSDLRTS